jgi:VWFA-related protein
MGDVKMLRCSLALILLAAVTLSSAQNLGDRDYKLTVDVELVQLPVSVQDKQGLPVRGLLQEHFTVYEDKVQQNISVFKQEDIPLSVGLVIDASGSMLDKRDRLNTAAMTFVRESNPDDETAIVSFGDEVFLEQDFTGNTGKLRRALEGISSNGNTALYDAVFLGAKHLQRNGSHEKKVLLVISDGEDNQSKYNLKQVLKAAGEWKITLYTVGLLNSRFSNYGPYAVTGKNALKQLAEVTGGAWFFPKTVNEVEEICARIARDLRNQYTIGYRPSNEKLDGSWRKVQVRINPPKNSPKLKVRTKQGYYAPLPGERQGPPGQSAAAEGGNRRRLSPESIK